MEPDTTVGSATALRVGDDIVELELPADDLDVVAEGLPQGGPQALKCDNVYCPAEYCARGYDSKG